MLKLHEVEKIFVSEQEATLAVHNISVEVEKGEFVAFIGPSGCGKTTVLSMIAGLKSPTSGTITVNDKIVKGPLPDIGYMLQQDYLFPWLTIKENIEIGLKITGHYDEDYRKNALQLLDEMDLYDKRNQYPQELSGGMKQRVALVRMLAVYPSLLLLDEPFSSLDYQTKLKLEDLVFTTLKEQNKTAVLVTHDLTEAVAMADRIILFSSRPGTIQNIFHVPEEIRSLLPFDARNHAEFTPFFQTIWKELEQYATDSS